MQVIANLGDIPLNSDTFDVTARTNDRKFTSHTYSGDEVPSTTKWRELNSSLCVIRATLVDFMCMLGWALNHHHRCWFFDRLAFGSITKD